MLGATALDELESILWVFYDANKQLPLLVPGVGAQGASAGETAKVLRTVWPDAFSTHRINSSSAIAYAHKKKGTDDFIGASLGEISGMIGAIGKV